MDANTSLSIQHVSNDRIAATLNVGGTTNTIATPNNAVQKGNTYHMALTYDGSTIRLFINGTLQASATASGAINQLACEDFLIGPLANGWMEATFNNAMTNGWIDSIRISSISSIHHQFHSTHR